MMIRFAMANALTIAGADDGGTNVRRTGEWLIVTRSPAGSLISISDAEPLDLHDVPHTAPDGLTPRNSLFGERIALGGASETYALRVTPPMLSAEDTGSFFPSVGFVRLSELGQTTRLSGSGIIASSPNTTLWNFEAIHVPWRFEEHT